MTPTEFRLQTTTQSSDVPESCLQQTQIRMYYFILISYKVLIQNTLQKRLGIETLF